MVGGDLKRKCPPGLRRDLGPKEKRRKEQKIQSKSPPASLKLEKSYFEFSKPNLKKRKRVSIEDDTAKNIETAKVKVIEVVLDEDDGEEIREEEEERRGEKEKDLSILASP